MVPINVLRALSAWIIRRQKRVGTTGHKEKHAQQTPKRLGLESGNDTRNIVDNEKVTRCLE